MAEGNRFPPQQDPRASRVWLVLVLLATLIGAWLRLDQIGQQIVADDEWHSLHAVRDHSLGWILTHFGACDMCIPLSALDWILAHTIGLSEMGMRIVPLLCGIVAVPVLSALLRRDLGARASLLFGLLLAISPIHVSYSRSARPYEVVFLLALIALLALRRWALGGRRSWAFCYVATGALAVWSHLVVAPFVLVPLVLCWKRGSGRVRSSAEVLRVGLCFGIALAVLIAPALIIDHASLVKRSVGNAHGLPDGETVFQLLSGSFRPVSVFVFGLAVLFGVHVLRHRPGLGAWLMTASLAQLLLVLLARPAMLEEPTVLVRYMVPAHALVLVLAALGLERIDDLVCEEFPRLARSWIAPLVVLGLCHYGPLPWIHERPNGWTNHLVFQVEYERDFLPQFGRVALGLQRIPPIYAELAREARDGDVLLEAPWVALSHFSPYPLFQRTHHLPMLAGFVTPAEEPLSLCELRADDARFRFTNMLHVARVEDLAARNVRFVVFHRDWLTPNHDGRQVDPRLVEPWIARYKSRFGAPRFEDERLCVFDLAAKATHAAR